MPYQWRIERVDKNENHNVASVYRIYIPSSTMGIVCAEMPEFGRGGDAFYIGYVLGTSHEPDQSARLPLHPKERRAPGWPLNCADETANRRYVTGRETNEPSHFRVLDPPSGDGTKTGARNRRRLKTGWNVDGSERGRNP